MFKSPVSLLTAIATLTLTIGAVTSAGAAGTGSVKGTVKLLGKAPAVEDLNMKADPFCAKRGGKNEEVIAGPAGQLKNVVVRISKGTTGAFPAPAKEATMDQDGCMYRPRVAVVQAGQPVTIKNSDQTLHNVHTYKGPATLFNRAQPMGFPAIKQKFPTVGDVVKFKCDVHPWMTGYLVVTDNPFWVVTTEDGAFTLPNVPPGKYTVEAWHERFGVKTAEITVTADKAADLTFEFAAK